MMNNIFIVDKLMKIGRIKNIYELRIRRRRAEECRSLTYIFYINFKIIIAAFVLVKTT